MRVALAGAGYFAQFHADAWKRIGNAELVAVADVHPERAASFGARSYSDVAAMLDAERPDVLDIATGPATHLDLVRLAASRGIAAITQKPMAPAWEDCVRMVETARAAGTRLLVHENWRWQPWYRETRRLLDRGAVGRVFHLGFRMRTGDGGGPEPYTVQPYFRSMDRLLVFETLVHFIDTFRFLGGPLVSIYCETARVNPVINGEDYAVLQLGFASGAHGLIDANRISGPTPNDATFGTLRIEGDTGVLRMDGGGRLFTGEREHLYDIPRTGYRGDSVLAFCRHAADCLQTGAPCESEADDYLKTVRAVEAAYESARTGKRIDL